MRRLLALGALLFTPLTILAEEQRVASFMVKYDVDSDSDIYCVLNGIGGPWGPDISGGAPIKTSGSSTSVTEVVTDSNPFLGMAVDDVILIGYPDGTSDTRVIVTFTDDSNVVVDEAIDLSAGYAFRWRDSACGTTITNGWIDVSAFSRVKAVIEYNQGDLGTGLDVLFEGMAGAIDAHEVTLYPGDIPATNACGGGTLTSDHCTLATSDAGTKAARLALDIPEGWRRVRIAINRNGTDSSDATTNRERVTAYIEGFVAR